MLKLGNNRDRDAQSHGGMIMAICASQAVQAVQGVQLNLLETAICNGAGKTPVFKAHDSPDDPS